MDVFVFGVQMMGQFCYVLLCLSNCYIVIWDDDYRVSFVQCCCYVFGVNCDLFVFNFYCRICCVIKVVKDYVYEGVVYCFIYDVVEDCIR